MTTARGACSLEPSFVANPDQKLVNAVGFIANSGNQCIARLQMHVLKNVPISVVACFGGLPACDLSPKCRLSYPAVTGSHNATKNVWYDSVLDEREVF